MESDANLPGGEAFVRQLVEGTSWFDEHLGKRCRGVWLPDSFGYAAALPQLAKLAGMDWFLTQKISWNQINDFPHHTFWWEGIDGSRIFTHFLPVDTYNATLAPAELHHAATNFRDKGRAQSSLVPYGYGDGGGGPTREMIEQARRSADLAGSPQIRIADPDDFFAQAMAEYADAPTWVGELYLELHRGTFTSQVEVKRTNRVSESLLHSAEAWSAIAAIRAGHPYPYEELQRIWRDVLLFQFHDILPGSSIAWVYREVVARAEQLHRDLRDIIDQAQRALGGGWFNPAPYARAGIPAYGSGTPGAGFDQHVTPQRDGSDLLLDNGTLRVRIDARGLVTSLVDLRAGRELIPAGEAGNLLQLHHDFPNAWDAWGIDEAHRHTVIDLNDADQVEVDGTTIRVRRHHGDSAFVQELRLPTSGDELELDLQIDWQQQDTLCKLAFPLDVHTDHARFEVQFGHLTRPTHTNTSWDHARFEVNAHRFVHLGEPDYQVAIANTGRYGWDVRRCAKPTGGTYSVVRASVVRGPRYPDPRADQGVHRWSWRLAPGRDVAGAAELGHHLNLPLEQAAGAGGAADEGPLVRLDGAVLETIKLARDRSGDLVLRLYEATGNRRSAVLTGDLALDQVREVDLLEQDFDERAPLVSAAVVTASADRIELDLRPFQVVTLRIPAGAAAARRRS